MPFECQDRSTFQNRQEMRSATLGPAGADAGERTWVCMALGLVGKTPCLLKCGALLGGQTFNLCAQGTLTHVA